MMVLPAMRKLLIPCVILALTSLSSGVFADDPEPPLYVSQSGSDNGNCDSVLSPCRSIDYALTRVGKNGQILVDSGTYELAVIENVVHLLSGAIDVRGTRDAGERTTLVGIPYQFADALDAKGFDVIVDSKGLATDAGEKLVAMQKGVQSNTAATVCSGGFAGIFPCNNVDLLSHVADRTPAVRGADIWGFFDLNSNREYAIVGYGTGTAVFDVSNAENPREVGFVAGQTTVWRDIKVHQFWNAAADRWNAYAYVTSDNTTEGLFIIDLNQLPHSISRVAYSSDFDRAHNVYLTDTEFSTGLSVTGDTPTLILAGSGQQDGRFRSYSLANPASPALIGAPSTPAGQPGNDRLYMHDAASMIVTDARKDSQCVNAAASDHCDILFDFNEGSFGIWDVTNRATPVRLSSTDYANAGYVHSGWWSEDQQYLFVQDELDERDNGIGATTLRVFSIADLAAPVSVGAWTGPTNAIDHNGFVRGNRYYMSNYTRGLSILDLSNPSSPTLAGRFDTYPSSDNVGFPGNWGTYPYFPSGNIGLSDVDSGFYMVADRTLDVAAGSLSFTADAFGGDESQTLDVTVQRQGGSQGAVSVNWEIVGATGTASDVAVAGGTVNWADGDTADKTINIAINNDGVVEGLERLLLRLTAPTGGATLNAPNIVSAYLSDPGAASSVEFSTPTLSISERGFGTAVAILHRSGSAVGTASVDYAMTAGDATAGSDFNGATSGTVSWADGDANPKWIEFGIVDDGSGEADEFVEFSLSNANGVSLGSNAQFRINILDGSGSNSAPNSVAGSSQSVASGANVTLNGSSSNDPDGDTLTYAWTQVMGTTVTLTNTTSATTSFTAPTVTSDTLLRFQLQVTDPGGQSDTSTVSITVSATGGGGSFNGGGGGGGVVNILLLLALLAASSLRGLTRTGVSSR